MSDAFRFSNTYLFKINALKHALDKIFDQVLQEHAALSLSQFMLLLAVSEHTAINQRAVACFLAVSTTAVNRQVEIAKRRNLLGISDSRGREQLLVLTSEGSELMARGLQAVNEHLAQVFADEDAPLSLMGHIDSLLTYTKGVSKE